jgi:UDP-2,3-diacylglucosamine hydrolase
MPAGRAAYFMSDAHLGAEAPDRERARERRLHDFLTALPGRAEILYIVGDLFDFWFEYRTAIPRRHFATLGVLKRTIEAGVPIVYLHGNHDFWLGPFLRETIGADTRTGAQSVRHQGRSIWLHHGDGLIGGDLGYRLLKRVVRHPVSIGLYGLLHPDLGIPLAHWVSGLSRHSREDRPPDPDRLWREIAVPRLAEGHDAVMVGHFHQAYERREGARAFFVLGDWIDQFTYVTLEDGEFQLRVWEGD